jgi:hypothetical protein
MEIMAQLITPQLWIILVLMVIVGGLAYLDRSGANVREEEFDATTGRLRQRRS